MNGPEHYREAERILDHAEEHAEKHGDAWYLSAIGAAQVHATLALVAATLEASAQRIDQNYKRPLILRPMRADESIGDPAYPGNQWGRALYGELS